MDIGFIGAGNMAQAIAKGLLTSYPAQHILVSAPTDRNLAFFEQLGCRTTHDNNTVTSSCNVVFLCIKPKQCEIALREVTWGRPSQLVISVMAGIPLERLYRLLGQGVRVIRCVPNTPMQVAKGVCCLSPGTGVPVQDTQMAIELLRPSCLSVHTVPEPQLDAICALAGSGPAFIYLIIEALSDGAVAMGLPRDLATELAAYTVEGAAAMVARTGKHPAELKDAVCSPGGTTIAGVYAMEKAGVRAGFMAAVEAATKRSIELRNAK
ncbi:pyrroline-5-carboxylate reductase-like [Tropilaelaps mercedesae]|uniref:Pyrroline-5-carboxylate reductase n=1 Tax=Tropilaelaps mercedesae TaxID=418985 RepID=A0A1V9X8S3_9ACAR|nr:pyrroline-5-carboxylate reductase-like [Tropilaelaps mercedesae]